MPVSHLYPTPGSTAAYLITSLPQQIDGKPKSNKNRTFYKDILVYSTHQVF